MWTTISIGEDLLRKAQKLSRRSGYSDAIVTALRDYVGLQERLAVVEKLFAHRTPHARARIKRARRSRRWSS